MDRTLRAVLLAAFVTFAVLAGLGMFLGFEAGASLITGVIAGALAALLLWGAARRAEGFHPDGPPPPVRPGFPGPPEHPDDTDDADHPERPDDPERRDDPGDTGRRDDPGDAGRRDDPDDPERPAR